MRRSVSSAASILVLLFVASCGGDDANTGTSDVDVDTAADTQVADTQRDIEVFFPDTEPDTEPDTLVADTLVADTLVADTLTSDTHTSCRTFGCSCSGNGDCVDELCIEGADGNICTRTCIADCPADFDCLAVTSFGTDPISVCVPRHNRLCRPCRTDLECDDPGDPYPAFCLDVPGDDPPGASGRFCGSSCANRACPAGYDCQEVALTSGGTARQCVPLSGECACRPAWSGLGYSTSCLVENAFGACGGARSCGPNGLTPCIGPQATPEVCDGQDNDCDGSTDVLAPTPCYVQNANGSCPGQLGCNGPSPLCIGPEPQPEACNGIDDNCNSATDEATCNDNLACTTDVCAAPFQCQNALIAGYCLVGGACFQSGQFNPLNACELCDTARSTATFSQAPNTCVIGGQCYPANATNPLNACQLCLPNQSNTTWSNASNTCQIGGQCYAANQANPSNACEICSPVNTATAWTQAVNTCNIQGQCFASGVKNPTNQCLVCDPSRSASGWSPASTNTSCNDQSACSTDDHCDGAGNCVGNTSCNDGIVCTADLCNAQTGCNNSTVADGYCRIANVCYASGAANPTNPCQRCWPATSKTAWSSQPNTVGCNDNLYCTTDDHCDGAGACVGTARSCGDAFACTTDACNENNDTCTNTLQASKCLIANACYDNGATQPNNVCYRCASGSSTSAWSLNNGASCNDGNECTSGDTCAAGTCAGAYIRDAFEDNDAIANAYNLGNYKDSDGWPQRTIATPTLSGPGDVDWYTYFVDDTAGGDVEPRVLVSSINASLSVEVCIYFRCTVNDAVPSNLECANAGGANTAAVTYGGKTYNGCCTSASSADRGMRFEARTFSSSMMECPGNDDDFRALVRVRSTNNNWTCSSPYNLQIGDD